MPEPIAYRSQCPLASALDIVGDKWSLVVLRGLFVGHTRYGDFLKGPETIASNILADRLSWLRSAGLLEQVPTKNRKGGPSHPRYRLTRKGADLLPALQVLAGWGFEHINGRWVPPAWFLKAKPSQYYPKDK